MCDHLGKRREVFPSRLCRYLIMNIALQTRLPALSEYYSETKCIWCDGCGNYGIWTAVKYALVELNLHPWRRLGGLDHRCAVRCDGDCLIVARPVRCHCSLAFDRRSIESWSARAQTSRDLNAALSGVQFQIWPLKNRPAR